MKNLMWKSLVALTLLSAPVHASVVSETTCYSDGVNGIGVTWADMPGLQNASTSTELTAAKAAVGLCTQSTDVDFDVLGKIDNPSEGTETGHQLVDTVSGIAITADYDFVSTGSEKYLELLDLHLPAGTDWTLVGVMYKGGNQDNHLYYDLDGLSLSILNDTLEKTVGNGRLQDVDVSHVTLFGIDNLSAVPVPAALPLALTGLAGLVLLGRRRRNA